MSSKPTAWHFFFAILLRRRGPRWVDVRDEVALAEERPRMDYLLLRKLLGASPDDPGQTLRGLWPRLPLATVVELKSIGRPYRKRGLDRLWSYVHAYWTDETNGLTSRAELCAVLIVPGRTPSLDEDAVSMNLVWVDLGDGYWELTGGLFRLLVAEIDVVAEREDDDLLRLFGHAAEHTVEARRFWAEQVGTKEAMMTVQEFEGYDEVVQKFLDLVSPELRLAGLAPEQRLAGLAPEQRLAGLAPEQRLAGLAPEQRLAGLAPEQRLAGLAPEQRLAGLAPEQILLALPDEHLRQLPETYLATLPERTREAIRRRLAG